MKRGLGAWLVIAGVAIGGLGAAMAQAPTAPDAARLEVGRRVYEREKCALCHQIAGRGNSRFPLDGVGKKLTPDHISRWITDTARMEDALPRMPAVRMSAKKYRLNPADLAGLVAYLGSLK